MYNSSTWGEDDSPHAKAWKERTGRPLSRDWASQCWQGERRTAMLQVRLEPSLKAALQAEADRRKPAHRAKASVSDVVRDLCIAGLMAAQADDADAGPQTP